MSQSQSLPLFYKNGRLNGTGGTKKFKEFHFLVLFLVTFVLAWISLTAYMPEIQHSDVSFQGTYHKFSPRFVLEEQEDDQPPNSFVETEAGGHMPVNRDIESNEIVEQQQQQTSVTEVAVEAKPSETEERQPTHGGGGSTVGREHSKASGTPKNSTVNDKRRLKVKEMIKHAWDGYVKYAFGENELKPMSRQGHSAGVFGKTRMGATLVDSLDTLYIVGLKEEFDMARKWVEEEFHIDEVNTDISLFEFNIRFVGGFLSAYALSGDQVFITKAKSVVDKLLPAFNTATGIPKSLVNLKTGSTKNWKWAAGGSSVLSEVGSLHLEFQYLTEVTNDPVYLEKVLRVRNKLREMAKPDGLYSNFINGDTGRWTQKHFSLGALGDSFYEYLIKSWLATSKKDTDGLNMFKDAVSALEPKLLQTKQNGMVVVTDYKGGRSDGKMQHLACFSGGMYALASQHIQENSQHYLKYAEGITEACHQSYHRSTTHLGPEAFRFDSEGSVISRSNEKFYLLRPETVESYFYLWRLTHNPKYREWGWEVVEALEQHCKVDNGYTGLKDVFRVPASKDDVQQSFFIAETLKYLYLLFSDDSVISLDNWVFNTEAHPLPVLAGVPSTAAKVL